MYIPKAEREDKSRRDGQMPTEDKMLTREGWIRCLEGFDAHNYSAYLQYLRYDSTVSEPLYSIACPVL